LIVSDYTILPASRFIRLQQLRDLRAICLPAAVKKRKKTTAMAAHGHLHPQTLFAVLQMYHGVTVVSSQASNATAESSLAVQQLTA
jgi:hypothetical protein